MQETDYIKKGDACRAPTSLLQKESEKGKSSKGKKTLAHRKNKQNGEKSRKDKERICELNQFFYLFYILT